MTLVEGWMYHTPAATGLPWDTAPAMDTLYKFGYVPPDNSAVLNQTDKITAERINQVGNYDTLIHMGNNPNGNTSGNFGMINGLPLYWMLGKVAISGDGVAITYLDGTKRKPRIATRQEIDAKNFHSYGMAASRLSMTYADNKLMANMSWMGCEKELSVTSPAAPTYPSDVATMYDVLTDMSWNTNQLRPTVVATELSQSLSPSMGEGGYYTEISEFSPIQAMSGFQIIAKEGEDAGMTEDYNAKTERTLTWTIAKSSDNTKRIVCTGDGYLIDRNISKGYGLQTIYSYNVWFSSLSFNVIDGLTRSTFYGL